MIIKEGLFEGPVGDYCIARNTIKRLFIKVLMYVVYVNLIELLVPENI